MKALGWDLRRVESMGLRGTLRREVRGDQPKKRKRKAVKFQTTQVAENLKHWGP